MRKFILIILLVCFLVLHAFAQHYSLTGKIVDSEKQTPIEFATLILSEQQLWATADVNGLFTIKNVPTGKVVISVSCLGYMKTDFELDIHSDLNNIVFALKENNLSLGEVVVTAREKTEAVTSSYTIDRTALDHIQTQSLSDITSLLPGGKTNTAVHLAINSPQEIELRSNTSSELDNNRFGTAIEVDGVRISSNSVRAFNETSSISSRLAYGTDVRSISSTNIESIEVVTGVPSVEHGDLTNGMVKVKTKEGKTPLNVEFASKPHTKQYALNKGFALGRDGGVMNLSLERTSSVSDLASPYTSYDRNGITLRYNNTFNKTSSRPIKITAGVSGNIGGYDSKADPDAYSNTYLEEKANRLRMDFGLNWLLNKSWITNVELTTSAALSDNEEIKNEYESFSSSSVSIHGMEEGYYMAEQLEDNPDALIGLIPRGHWYEKKITDDKPRDYSVKLKANWSRRFDKIVSNFLFGGEFSYTNNTGKGIYYDTPTDEKYTYYVPTWREYKYSDQPGMKSTALFVEEKIDIPIKATKLQIVAGLRTDITSISRSAYGTVSSFSPRFNAKYTFWDRQEGLLKKLTIRAGWGKSVKLPSIAVLNPTPSYSDRLAFASTSMSDGTAYYGYHIYPVSLLYNPDLKWQSSNLTEIGVEARLGMARISVTAFYNKTKNPYKQTSSYSPYTYNLTDQTSLNNVPIPSEDRLFTIDKTTGIVTVSDKSGVFPAQQLDYKTRLLYKATYSSANASDVSRKGLEWIVDFDKIPALNTSFRWDGSYYYYKGVDETLTEYSPSTQLTTDGNFYKYVGYYIGGNSSWNGQLTKQLNSNLTITTHIPKVRLIVSMRIEASLYNCSRYLSEYSGGNRSFVLENRDSYVPGATDGDIYAGDQPIGTYPLYYSTIQAPSTKILFREAFLNAKENDPALFNELARLVSKTSYNYSFNKNTLSPYVTANISVTKELGKIASLSFEARNFTNTTARVKYSQNESVISLYGSGSIPKFYYGLSLRIKL